MAELYPWFVFAHLLGLVVFAISHGASVFMSFRLRGERDHRSDLARMLDSRRPDVRTLVGTVGLMLLVWLMVIKPG